MGVFEDLHRSRVTGSLAMFDRMIFKGRLTALYKENGAKCFLWSQGVALKDFTPYAKWTTAKIADTVRGLADEAGRPSKAGLSVSRWWPVPSAFITYTSKLASRVLVNAIRLPSGDHAGCRSRAASRVSCWTRWPSPGRAAEAMSPRSPWIATRRGCHDLLGGRGPSHMPGRSLSFPTKQAVGSCCR